MGRNLVDSLAETNHSLRLIVHKKKPAWLPDTAIESVDGDVHDLDSLVAAFKEMDVVYHLVGIIAETRELTFERTVVGGTINVVKACKYCGVKRIIYLSALGTSRSAVSEYHQSKWKAEEAIRNSQIDYTIFRPSVIFGKDDKFINKLVQMVRRFPLVPVVGDGKARLQPVYIRDLAAIMRDCLQNEKVLNKTIKIGGPEELQYKEIISILKKLLKKKRGNLYLPMWLLRFNALVLERVMKPAPITTDQLRMMEAENVCNNRELHDLFDIKLTRLEKGLRKYMR